MYTVANDNIVDNFLGGAFKLEWRDATNRSRDSFIQIEIRKRTEVSGATLRTMHKHLELEKSCHDLGTEK